ncbi:MAG: metallophosphoesterase [Victivallaceae bacterium]|nr:metallophosphoesterase [Victivallaceae bacterium]
MDDTKTQVWTPDDGFFDRQAKRQPAVPPPIVQADLSHFAELPMDDLVSAARKYEKKVNQMLELCDAQQMLPPMAFCSNPPSRVPTISDRSALPANLWYIGDLHGDLLSLVASLDYIDHFPAEEPPTIVFLGDAFDRFGYGYEVLLVIFNLMLERPGKIMFLVGNHDVELYYKKRFNVFYPGVMPANFCEWLNVSLSEKPELSIFGQRLITLMRRMPHALFLPDGMVAAHGGVPHTDVQRTIHSPADLDTINARQDFVWGRFDPRHPRVMPDRARKDVRLGYQDFNDFCDVASEALDMPVMRMIHGHEHPLEQWMFYPRYLMNPILTINTHRIATASGSIDKIAVARHRPDTLPEVHLLELAAKAE